MILEFAIKSGVIVEGANYWYDLHNDYELQSIAIEAADESTMALRFKRYTYPGQGSNLPLHVTILFRALEYLSIDRAFFLRSHDTVNSIGFKEAANVDSDWEVDFQSRQLDMHMVVSFFDGGTIRVCADIVSVESEE